MRNNDCDTKVEKKAVACGNCSLQLYSYQTLRKPCKVVFGISHITNCGFKSFLTSRKSSHYKHHREKQFVQPHAKKKSQKSYRIITLEGQSEPQICIINQLSYGCLIQHSKTAKCSIYSGILYCPPSPCTSNSSCSDEL